MRLDVHAIRKAYAGVEVLHGVDLSADGEVLAIVGANGAGKSTLVRILSGAVVPDSGEIRLDGRRVLLNTPYAAHTHGIRTVHQELSLVPQLSVTENLLLGALPTAFGLVNWRAAHAHAGALLRAMGFAVDPRATVADLSVARRHMVEIVKALRTRPGLLILDEPSAVLARDDLDSLFGLIRELRGRGVLVLYVSHRIAEVLEISDRVCVLNDGRVVATVPAADTTEAEIVRWMAGRRLDRIYPPRDRHPGPVLLRVDGLARGNAFRDVSFTVRAGEIVGMFGLVGSGRSAVAHCLFGAARPAAGAIEIGGRSFDPASPGEAIAAGVALVTEDGARDGLVPGMSVRDNVTLATALRRPGLLNRRRQAALAARMVRRLDIRPTRTDIPVVRLSGGNQQKIVLAKWLLTTPRILVLDEPTRGVDMTTRVDIYRMLDELARSGVGILMVSADLAEVLGATDRVLVMREGRLVAELASAGSEEHEILAYALGRPA